MEARRLGLVIINKREKGCQSIIIIVSIQEDGRVRAKEDEKVEKYPDFASESRRMCSVRTRMIIGIIISFKGEE